jgi:hypothetical protein
LVHKLHSNLESRVPTQSELMTCQHVHMTCQSLWNPTEVCMVQALSQGGSTPPWKQRLSQIDSNNYESIDATSDEALLHSVDPMLAHDVNE